MNPLIVAHCGDMQNAPESTFAAFNAAVEKAADVIEFDVHLTADGKLLIHHDYYLGRTENGQGAIGEHIFADLRKLDIGSWFASCFAMERMLTLAEVLELGRGKVHFEIDMRAPDLILLRLILAEIERFGVAADVELTSVHTPLLIKAKQMAPNIATGVFFSAFPEWMTVELGQQHIIGWMKLMDAQVAHLHISQLDERFVSLLHNQGYLVHGANLNTAQDILRGFMVGVDQFSTDVLDLALRIKNESNS